MPTTQHRPIEALAGRRFGSFADKTATAGSSHPVGRIAQHRPHSALSGRRYGSFAGKTASAGGEGWTLEAPLTVALTATFGASGEFSFAVPTVATITVRLVDAAVSGSALPSLTGIEWAWWDAATKESETWGVAPTNSGTTESTDGSGSIVLQAPLSTKTSGQQAFVKLYLDGANPRTFGALLTVD